MQVAIKKVTNAFQDLVDAKRILREMKLLRHFNHENVCSGGEGKFEMSRVAGVYFSSEHVVLVVSQVISLKDLMNPASKDDFEDIYIVFGFMETVCPFYLVSFFMRGVFCSILTVLLQVMFGRAFQDMHKIIYSKNELTDEHVQYFAYQMLRGLRHIHAANVIHRDLVRPSENFFLLPFRMHTFFLFVFAIVAAAVHQRMLRL